MNQIINLSDINVESFSEYLIGVYEPFNIMGVKPLNNHFELANKNVIRILSLSPVDLTKYLLTKLTIINELFFAIPILKRNRKISQFQNQLSPPLYT